MAKINRENLSLFRNADDLVDFITLHRFEPENANITLSEEFSQLHQSWKDVIYLYDFETFFDFYGLYAYLSHRNGFNLDALANSLKNLGFDMVSDKLNTIHSILEQHNTSIQEIQISDEERLKMEESEEELELTPLQTAILGIEEDIRPIMDEKDYWEVLKENLFFVKPKSAWED